MTQFFARRKCVRFLAQSRAKKTLHESRAGRLSGSVQRIVGETHAGDAHVLGRYAGADLA